MKKPGDLFGADCWIQIYIEANPDPQHWICNADLDQDLDLILKLNEWKLKISHVDWTNINADYNFDCRVSNRI